MTRDLRGKTIIITGASSGIGAATAIECAAAGMNTVLSARREDRLLELARRIEALGRESAVVAGDVNEPGISQRMLEAAANRFGRIDAVFANAGYGIEKPVVHLNEAELRKIFDVNFFSCVELIQLAAREMIDRGTRGHLLMCSSCLAKFTLPHYSAYSATKAAQNHLCRAMGIELRPHGIAVSSVHPITTTTEFFEAVDRHSGKGPQGSVLPEHSPSMFVQTPQRVARAVVACLRRPRPEVWTSTIVRATAAMMTLSPRFADLVMRRVAAVDARERAAAGDLTGSLGIAREDAAPKPHRTAPAK
jgi:short-subunit dehydrogenase